MKRKALYGINQNEGERVRMKKHEAETMVVNINLTRGLVVVLTLALLTAGFLGYLAWGREEVSASNLQAPLGSPAGMRQYYLTTSTPNGAGASTACADGYHMASLWEILDTSNLKYNTTLGVARDDSGQGLPTDLAGWVRTGYDSSNISTPGMGNCNAWSSSDVSDYGTRAWLEEDWTLAQEVHVWQVGNTTCNWPSLVWCVED
jgi:hypothetical protein